MKNNKKIKRMSQVDILYTYYKSLEPSKKSYLTNGSSIKSLNSQKRISEQGKILKEMLKYQLKKN